MTPNKPAKDIDEILLKAGVPKGIHRIVYDPKAKDPLLGTNKLSNTDTFTEAKTALTQLLLEARIEELEAHKKEAWRRNNIEVLDKRIAELKALKK